MFGIGMQEVALICAIALVVVGPKRLPEIARALGKGYAEFRRAFDDMKRTVATDVDAEEIRRSFLDLPPAPTPPPPPAAAAPPPAASLLTEQPAPLPVPSPYPEVLDATPPPPETAAAPVPPHAPEGDRGRA